MCDGTFSCPAFHGSFQAKQHYFVPVTQADVDRVNAANTWKISLVKVSKGSIKVPGPPSKIVNPPRYHHARISDGLGLLGKIPRKNGL